MDLQIQRQRAHRGKGFAGLQFGRENRAGGGVDYLVENRLAGDQLELELGVIGPPVSQQYCDTWMGRA